ncbi:hypothetical protein CLV25_106184 [Acetobacteroides hydrogenigenes]|uniref:Uncharacterized protein n=1 Tax=Acetobacteroides hydrogenigenes TaxID=979970 RepID=A0A4R2EMY2_9BACT|nr:hypothetical protein CLV25_106184 [Acetobacteroides hydrogenigenes]
MKHVRKILVGISILALLYLIVFTDMSFSKENSIAWIFLLAISAITYGLDFLVIQRRRNNLKSDSQN